MSSPSKIVRTIGLALILVAGPAAAIARDEISRNFEKSLPLGAGQRVSIEHSHGAVEVTTHKDATVQVSATIRVSATSRERAEKFAADVRIEVEATGAGVSIRTVYPERHALFGDFALSYSVDYRIAMPENAPLSLRNRFGDVSVAGLKAASEVVNSNGHVAFRDGAGRQRLENSFGAVDLTGNAGDAVIVNGNGAVTVSDVQGDLEVSNRFGRTSAARTGKKCTVTSSNGDVSVDGAGSASVEASFGKLDVRNVSGELSARNSNGAITAAGVGGKADLATSFGTISFTDMKAAVDARGSNSAVNGRKTGGGVMVRTTFGGVELADVGGPADVENANGKILVRDVRGGARLTTRFGDVDAAGIAGDAVVSDSNGRVTLANVDGSADVRNSFGETSLTRIKKGAKVVSGNGRVALTEVGAAAYVKTSFGAVEASGVGGRADRRELQRERAGVADQGRPDGPDVVCARDGGRRRRPCGRGRPEWSRGRARRGGRRRVRAHLSQGVLRADPTGARSARRLRDQRADVVRARLDGDPADGLDVGRHGRSLGQDRRRGLRGSPDQQQRQHRHRQGRREIAFPASSPRRPSATSRLSASAPTAGSTKSAVSRPGSSWISSAAVERPR